MVYSWIEGGAAERLESGERGGGSSALAEGVGDMVDGSCMMAKRMRARARELFVVKVLTDLGNNKQL